MDSDVPSGSNPEDAEPQEDMHKTSAYVRTVVTLHNLRDKAKDAVENFQDINFTDKVNESWNKTQTAVKTKTRNFCAHPENVKLDYIPQEYGYVFRPKSCWELVLLGGTVCGIEFCYAAETAFVTPILLGLGLNIKFVTMIWCLSPLIGLILTPILGSMSDSCESFMGRRRPFILLYSIGILAGLILVSNGHLIGLALGDSNPIHANQLSPTNTSLQDNETGSNSGALRELNANAAGLTQLHQEPDLHLLLSGTYKDHDSKISTLNPSKEVNSHDMVTEKLPETDFGSKSNSSEMHQEPDLHLLPSGNDRSRESKLSTYNPSSIGDNSYGMEKLPESNTGIKSHSSGSLLRRRRQTKIDPSTKPDTEGHIQPWSIVFTVIGTMLLDFCSDACQSPSRTYMLDVSIPDDHAAGLSTFTLMAGLGGSIGYMMGAIQWEDTFLGRLLGGQVSVVFTIVTVVFIICLVATVCSFPEIPLSVLRDPKMFNEYQEKLQTGNRQFEGLEMSVVEHRRPSYGAVSHSTGFENSTVGEDCAVGKILPSSPEPETLEENLKSPSTEIDVASEMTTAPQHPTLVDFLKSIVHMPRSLKILCLTNLFCWMSLVCYSLYFTDFVAECVFGGHPQALEGTVEYTLYKDGVRFGCWGMSLYSLSCAVYSYFIEALVKKIGAKPTYIGGQLVYSIGMVIMAATRHKVAVILLSPTAGVMYATLFTMPYLLIAHYHCTNKFCDSPKDEKVSIRGIGTDVAAVSSMVFLSQFILSMSMGSIVEAVGSNVATVCAASLLSACGALCASRVLYLDI